MQNKGALKVLVIALLIAAAYALSFTFVARGVEKKADAVAAAAGIDQGAKARQAYLDSMKTQTAYNLGFVKFTYGEVKEKEINLGLDLKGGMNVMLEIYPEDIIRALSGHSQDATFSQAVAEASAQAQKTGSAGFVDDFARAYQRLSGGSPLIHLFSTPEVIASRALTVNASDAQVVTYLKSQVESAIENSYMIISKRIDRFGITQPNIQRVKNTGRILVELPGVKEPERVRKLLQGTASLEFWMTYENASVLPVLEQIDSALALKQADTSASEEVATEEVAADASASEEVAADTTALGEGLLGQIAAEDAVEASGDADFSAQHPLFSRLQLMVDESGRPYQGDIVGMAESYNIPVLNEYFAMPEVRALMPHDLRLLWAVKGRPDPVTGQESNVFELYAIRDRSGKGLPELDGGAVETASGDYSQNGSAGVVHMSMNRAGADTWERVTRDALDATNHAAGFSAHVAIVLDSTVYSAPVVNDVISGGQSQITGNFTLQEAQDLANVLRSGKLPAPARIKQEELVGPTLGAESIQKSMISFVLAFLLVLVYMIVFYNRAGWVASLALLSNLFLLFGILVSFGAVLTLPGIAGIVLTMGMAVDANVLIYERIKEELRAGKTTAAAVQAGYKNAMSAIIDSNVTTMLTGIILFWFGTGPVQGFATTLIIGIITSLFTSIFVTRLIINARLNRGKNVTFSNKVTENFLAHTKFDFLGKRKAFYGLSLALVLVGIVSLFTLKLNPGVDFTGGRTFTVRFDQPVNVEKVRTALDETFATIEGDESSKSILVTEYGRQDQVRIITQYLIDDDSNEAAAQVVDVLYKALNPLYATPLTPAEFASTETTINGIISSETVGASVAREIVINAFWAVLLGLAGIGIYVIARFRRWQWGVGSVAGLAHDAFLTVGVYSLLWKFMPFTMEVDQSFIAAILTIIGYSINDKVVIFDRIREYQTLYPKRSIRENINNAINSTLARTINTSGTTIVTLLAIFLFGGEVIRGFVFALLFGIIVGTYSSIFIATPVAYDLMKREKKK
jgi:SecD/SecF fusion protein